MQFLVGLPYADDTHSSLPAAGDARAKAGPHEAPRFCSLRPLSSSESPQTEDNNAYAHLEAFGWSRGYTGPSAGARPDLHPDSMLH